MSLMPYHGCDVPDMMSSKGLEVENFCRPNLAVSINIQRLLSSQIYSRAREILVRWRRRRKRWRRRKFFDHGQEVRGGAVRAGGLAAVSGGVAKEKEEEEEEEEEQLRGGERRY